MLVLAISTFSFYQMICDENQEVQDFIICTNIVGSLKSLSNSQDQRNKNEHSKVQSQDLQQDFTWFSNVVQQCAYIHGKVQLIIITFIMEITSSIQAKISFNLSRFLSNKTSLNLLALYLLSNSLSLYENLPLFSFT